MSDPVALEGLLCCPACRAVLTRGGDGWRCSAGGCPLSQQVFAEVEGKPVLIDPLRSLFGVDDVRVMSAHSAKQRTELRAGAGFSVVRSIYRFFRGYNKVAAGKSKTLVEMLPATRKRILIIGGGTRGEGTDPLWDTPGIDRVAFDVYASPNVDFVADGHAIPLADGSIDGVWIQAVLEHVLDPHRVVSEIERVLAPDGLVYAETPFMQQVHEGAFDFFRFSHSAHRWLFRNFTEVESGAVFGVGTTLLWSVRYFWRGITGSNAAARVLSLPFFWVRLFDAVGNKRKQLDGASGLFFLGRKSAAPMDARDLAAYYRGAGSRSAA